MPFKRGPFGSALRKDIFVSKGYKVYEQQNAIHDVNRERYFITEEKFIELRAYEVKANDLIISCSGATLGRISEIPSNAPLGIINQALLKVDLNELLINNSYFIHLFRSLYMQNNIFKKAWGTAIPNMAGVKELKKILIPLPPLEEQKAIVSITESLFKQIDELHTQAKNSIDYREKSAKALFNKINTSADNEELQETWQLLTSNFNTLTQSKESVKELRQSILQMAIQGRLTAKWRKENPDVEAANILLEKIIIEKEQLLRNGKVKRQKPISPITEEDKPFALPLNWKWAKLCDLSNRIHYGLSVSAKPDNKEIRLLRITDIQNNKVNWNSVPGCEYKKADIANYLLEENDIVIARTGGTIGKSFLIKEIPVRSLFASYLIRIKPSKWIFSEYLKRFIESPCYWDQLHEHARRAAQPNVSGTKLRNLSIALPPIQEQKIIVMKVERLLSHCDELVKKIERQGFYQKQIMQSIVKKASNF